MTRVIASPDGDAWRYVLILDLWSFVRVRGGWLGSVPVQSGPAIRSREPGCIFYLGRQVLHVSHAQLHAALVA